MRGGLRDHIRQERREERELRRVAHDVGLMHRQALDQREPFGIARRQGFEPRDGGLDLAEADGREDA